jgi:hypothetical protein
MSTATEPKLSVAEARKERDRALAEEIRARDAKSAGLEQQFINADAIIEWATLQDIPLVLDETGRVQKGGFLVAPELIEEFRMEVVAAMRDAIKRFEGKVRQGRVSGSRFTLG